MKNSVWPISFILVVISLGFLGFKSHSPSNTFVMQEVSDQVEIPQNVQVILDRSCLPCHGVDGSGKAKMKWNYEKMNEYNSSKLVSKLVKITENVSEGDMPPPKNIKKNPDRKLSEEDKSVLINWADGLAEKMTNSAN
jgi:mono/diheme cytochrome c family protein